MIVFICKPTSLPLAKAALKTPCYSMQMYRVWQKSRPVKFLAVFSATVWNFNLKFYRFIYWNILHPTGK